MRGMLRPLWKLHGIGQPGGGLHPDCSNAIHMLVKVLSDVCAEGIEDDIYPFPSGELGGRYKVAVAGHKDDLIYLSLERHGSDVQPDPHVDTLLNGIQE